MESALGKRCIVYCWVKDALRRLRIAKLTTTRGITNNLLTSSACSIGIWRGEDETWTTGPWTPTLDRVHGPLSWTGSMDPPVMDRVHGQFVLVLDWSVMFNCAYIVEKRGGGRYLMPKCCLLQWIVFSDGWIMLPRKTFWLSKCEFLPLISYWEVLTHRLIFYLFYNVKLFIAAD